MTVPNPAAVNSGGFELSGDAMKADEGGRVVCRPTTGTKQV